MRGAALGGAAATNERADAGDELRERERLAR